MKLNKIIKNVFEVFKSRDDSKTLVIKEAKKDARQYERFFLCHQDIASIRIENMEELNIVNVSYGGFAILYDPVHDTLDSKVRQAKLKYFDQEVPALVQKMYRSSNLIGYMFEHQNPETLVFLREIIEYLRYGSTLRTLEPRLLQERYQSPGWFCLRGEGATDISFRYEDNDLIEFLCTFRSGEFYQELRYRDATFSTGKSIDRAGVSSRVQSTVHVDKDILRRAITILLGLREEQNVERLEKVFLFAKDFLVNDLLTKDQLS